VRLLWQPVILRGLRPSGSLIRATERTSVLRQESRCEADLRCSGQNCRSAAGGENPEAPPVADEARDSSEQTQSDDAAPRRQRDNVCEGKDEARLFW